MAKNFRSGMLSAWNKACFTGGYVEARVQLPGKRGVPSFWPAIWMMGNLGRAGYMYSTAGQWPYSFNACPSGPNVGPNPAAYPWSPPITPQMFTACGAVGLPAGVSAEDWGMSASLGRGAPEIDIFEAVIPATGSPQVSQTLQMAPVQPPGSPYNAAGLSFPGAATAFRTRLNPWQGVLGRSGNIYQDSISAVSDINDSFFNSFHTFGLDWVPGQYVRWYIDGVLVYGVTKDAVGAASNGTWSVPPRQIPVEAMYIVMNLGMSKDFSPDLDANAVQPLPAEMLIDYVRRAVCCAALCCAAVLCYVTVSLLCCSAALRMRTPAGCGRALWRVAVVGAGARLKRWTIWAAGPTWGWRGCCGTALGGRVRVCVARSSLAILLPAAAAGCTSGRRAST